jgi:hypothetical protein
LFAELEARTARHAAVWQLSRQDQALDEIRQALLRDIERRVTALLGPTDAAERQLVRVLTGVSSVREMADELMRKAIHDSLRRPPDEAAASLTGANHHHQTIDRQG